MPSGENLFGLEPVEASVVREDEDTMCGAFQVVPPVLEGVLDGVELLIVYLVVAFRGGEGSGVVGDGVNGVVRGGEFAR